MKEIIPGDPALRRLLGKDSKKMNPEAKVILELVIEVEVIKEAIQELQDIIRKNKLE